MFINYGINSLYAGVPFGEMTIWAAGGNRKMQSLELRRDLSLKQSYVVAFARHPGWTNLELIQKWVDETFGARTPGYHNPRWSSDGFTKWCFRKESDAMLFMMRWS